MREAVALIRAAALTAASYRTGMVMSVVGLAAVVLPLYFIAGALQPVMERTIAAEAQQYFAFVVVGAVTFALVTAATTSLPGAVEGAIGRGTLEMILATPARLPAILAGLMGYSILWAMLRVGILLVAAILLGAPVVWDGAAAGAGILALTMLAHVGIGLVLAACVLAFRTAGPLSAVVLTSSMLLGGVYYPTRVIPSWLRDVGEALPLTHGLRALRQVVLRGDAPASVANDVGALALSTVALLALGTAAFVSALAHARRTGTLTTY